MYYFNLLTAIGSDHQSQFNFGSLILHSDKTPQNCPSNGAFNSESPITELVMMASPRCGEEFRDPRYYIETLRDHKNNCEFDVYMYLYMKPESLQLICLVMQWLIVLCDFSSCDVHNLGYIISIFFFSSIKPFTE